MVIFMTIRGGIFAGFTSLDCNSECIPSRNSTELAEVLLQGSSISINLIFF
jgi:hypothetical protein